MELIKLKVRKESSQGDSADLIIQKFKESCINLDASIFESLIKVDQYFDDLDKFRFLQSLKNEFDRVKAKGITTTTTLKEGECLMCFRGSPNFEFYGKDTKPEFAYIIHKEEGIIINIVNRVHNGPVVNLFISILI